jgi:uncharacterized DUF497 family protein
MFVQSVAGFEWDEGNWGKCQQHGVSVKALESAFHQTMAVFPDPAHSQNEERFIAIGKTDEGRHVFAAFTLAPPWRRDVHPSCQRPLHAPKGG